MTRLGAALGWIAAVAVAGALGLAGCGGAAASPPVAPQAPEPGAPGPDATGAMATPPAATGPAAGPASGAPAGTGAPAAEASVVSTDILAREPLANTATVKHILIGWNELAESYGGRLDPRAAKRTKAEAEAEVRSLLKQLAEGADFEAMMKASSEDTGSALNGRSFTVTPDAQLVIEFRQLSLRLRPGEIGVIQSDFGFHIIKRVS